MNFVIPALFVLALAILPLSGKKYITVHLKRLVLPFACIVFILVLILFSGTAVDSAAKGLALWFNIVFPSLFPFFVASHLLNGSGFVRAGGILLEPLMRPLFNVPGCGSFAFLMGITSGYPVGAKITAGMRKEKLLTKSEAERLLAFSNNSGPLFIVGAVSTGMFKMQRLGLFLLACHIAACITVGIILGLSGKKPASKVNMQEEALWKRFKKELLTVGKMKNASFGTALGRAVEDSIMTLLAIGGFIMLFSVIINLLMEIGVISQISSFLSVLLSPFGINERIISSVVGGFFEITTGANLASSSHGAPLQQKLAAVSLIIGWAGLSVHSQVLSIISGTDISMKTYLLGKFLQGIFASVYALAGFAAFGESIPGNGAVFLAPEEFAAPVFAGCFIVSVKQLLVSFLVLTVLTAITLILGHKLKAHEQSGK